MKTDFKKPDETSKHLSDLKPGETGIVLEVNSESPIAARLQDMGLLPQTPVRALRRAPLGDPSLFEFRGYRLCLRKADAAQIRIEHSPGQTDL
ncbi:MAG: ferrous iron transport protein A [Deltaproteobacteria bacterium]|nr:ferrous iron transport protein A [Deltaproteobacteria bacterium]